MSTLQLPARRYSATTVRGGLGPKANCTLEICPVEFSVYGYRPRLPPTSPSLSCIYAAAVHIYLGARWKQWWFTSCMIIGAVNAIIGYIGRVLMYYSPFDFAAFVLQIICITNGPGYYCAAIYITLTLTINFLSPDLSPLQAPNLLLHQHLLRSLLAHCPGGRRRAFDIHKGPESDGREPRPRRAGLPSLDHPPLLLLFGGLPGPLLALGTLAWRRQFPRRHGHSPEALLRFHDCRCPAHPCPLRVSTGGAEPGLQGPFGSR